MRNLPLIFLGVFFTLAFSWTGIVLIPHLQFGDLELTSSELIEDPATPGEFIVDPDADLFPRELTGAATRGKAVYMQMGCIYCHSQQVRRRGFGVLRFCDRADGLLHRHPLCGAPCAAHYRTHGRHL